jgi:arsenate reductase
MNQADSQERAHTVVFTSEGGVRARIAAAWFNLLAHPAKAQAVAACAEPSHRISAEVEGALREIGVVTPPVEQLTPERVSAADLVIHLGVAEPERLPPHVEQDLWAFASALGATSDAVRRDRDAIEKLVRHLLAARRWLPIGASIPPR